VARVDISWYSEQHTFWTHAKTEVSAKWRAASKLAKLLGWGPGAVFAKMETGSGPVQCECFKKEKEDMKCL